MPAQQSTRSVDGLILRLARRQQGVVERGQLLAAGVSRHEIATRLADGRLVEIHRGVYLVGAVPGPHAHEMAAILACGRNAVLSHRSAAALWQLLFYPATAPVWVTIPPERHASRRGLKIIRARLERRDIRCRQGMLLTSPPRAILDMAWTLGLDDLEPLLAEANYRGLAREAELVDQVERNPGKPGVGTVRKILGLPGGPKRTRSPAERRLLRLLRERGIDGFEANAKILGYEVDFLWRDLGFVVEVDGWDGHSGRVAFERDRLKIARLIAGGLRVMPVTGRQLRRQPEAVIGRMRRALDAERARRLES